MATQFDGFSRVDRVSLVFVEEVRAASHVSRFGQFKIGSVVVVQACLVFWCG